MNEQNQNSTGQVTNNVDTTNVNNNTTSATQPVIASSVQTTNNDSTTVNNTQPVMVDSTKVSSDSQTNNNNATPSNRQQSGSQDNKEEVIETLDANATDKGLKQVDVDYKPPSGFRTFLLIVFFVFLIAFVIFLPDINKFVEEYKARRSYVPEEEIVNGKLVCNLDSTTENFDITYDAVFEFTDKKISTLTYTTTTKGDASLDEAALENELDKCNSLISVTKDLDGINVDCDSTSNTVIEKEDFTLASVNVEDLRAAFTEAGGTYPEFENGQEIDSVEKKMLQAGYTCKKDR